MLNSLSAKKRKRVWKNNKIPNHIEKSIWLGFFIEKFLRKRKKFEYLKIESNNIIFCKNLKEFLLVE